MSKCVLHPGSTSVISVFGKNYCEPCKQGIEKARKAVSKEIVPKDCFITYKNSKEGWAPIDGTGCAHWVAHEKNLHKGSKSALCLAGFTLRVPDALSGKSVVTVDKVKVGDFYATPSKDHMGLVVKVTPAKKEGDPPIIMIQHDSSGQGKLATDEFSKRFHSKGNFYH
jgi:hypothetical protein